ncbi:MAG: 7-cyano-7-deazaguanine reductase [Candidatus Cloacimonetes bacterium]|nr:7-cyano-7-deazaguanine reductase [Candidatus Cloacimonadota bacterium]MBS3766565.1 7-cyano-7-deazaguanine reductase [Candidatus Cloacimonadota bacterium]
MLVKAKPDESLLKPIPRKIGRKNIGWKPNKIPFCGTDIWNCYEFSFLQESGKPVTKILRIEYPAYTPNLIESKSLKLYLNSFNMVKFCSENDAISVLKNDLKDKLETDNINMQTITAENFSGEFTNTVAFKNLDKLKIERKIFYEYNPDLLKVKCNANNESFLKTNLLKSNCPLTGQPDWGAVYIYYKSAKTLDDESFLRYIISYRTLGEYHEECCESILYDLNKILNPEKLLIFCKYTRRGGIDINPLRVYPAKENYLDSIPQIFKKIIYTRDFRQ